LNLLACSLSLSSDLFLKMSSCTFLAMLFMFFSAAASDQWVEKKDEEGRAVQSLQIQAPSMTEEDQYGYTMPDQYRCDACKAVTYHIGEALKQRQPKNRRLKEWEYTEIFDDTCKSGFTGYGVTLMDGQNVLSGPALQRNNDIKAGMGAIQMGGETWEKRLGETCRKFVYDKIGEEELYEHFRNGGTVSSDLCFRETRDCELGPKTPQKKDAASTTSKSKKGEKAKKQNKDVVKSAEMDLATFVGKLAKKHGLAKSEYTRKRSFEEWENTFAQVAQRISEQKAALDQVAEV